MATLNETTAAWLKKNKKLYNASDLERRLKIPRSTLKTFHLKSGYVPEQWVQPIEVGLQTFICPDMKAWKSLVPKLFSEWDKMIAIAKKDTKDHIQVNAKHEQIIDDLVHIFSAFKNSNPIVAEMIRAEANKRGALYFKQIVNPVKQSQ